MSRGTLESARSLPVSCTGLSPSVAGLPSPFHCRTGHLRQSVTPERTRSGLGSFRFARRYSGNRCFFLFLALLRCFSSGGSRRNAMDSRYDAWGVPRQVSPFRNLRIKGYLLLPEAYRSLSRLSSALSAKASALRSLQLDQYAFALRVVRATCTVHSVALLVSGLLSVVSAAVQIKTAASSTKNNFIRLHLAV